MYGHGKNVGSAVIAVNVMRRRSIAGWAKIYFIFPPYRFTHPKTDESIVVRRWSYLWAGLFGAFYVAWKGMGSRFLLADRKSTRLNSSHSQQSRMPSSA